MSNVNTARRGFLVKAALLAAVPFVAPSLVATARAQELKPLPLDNPQAKALAYAEDASKVQHPSHKPDANCGNCQFFTAATGACTLFPGFKVPAAGWCSAWAKKA